MKYMALVSFIVDSPEEAADVIEDLAAGKVQKPILLACDLILSEKDNPNS